ncbi:hypothetical protein G5714_016477 [Onychostoma macrolepis]|uniref:Uncharacterized protein n=1 Tax=Onychostoma macrolepis TaxID=369639 RepID=A0A7J6C982_9TELE|nr:hypothetical protein G5714_016477 [Onychostoma macrolepis]
MSMIHITIKQKGQEPRPRRCHADATLFTCPFCTTDIMLYTAVTLAVAKRPDIFTAASVPRLTSIKVP